VMITPTGWCWRRRTCWMRSQTGPVSISRKNQQRLRPSTGSSMPTPLSEAIKNVQARLRRFRRRRISPSVWRRGGTGAGLRAAPDAAAPGRPAGLRGHGLAV
jgi:hypothetical protein